jgi:GTP-binding protein
MGQPDRHLQAKAKDGGHKQLTSDPIVSDTDDAARIEEGRRLFARPWHFVLGAPTLTDLPAVDGIEVAFAGRSNVGKSSLINALVGQRALARTSNTPGRTQELNFFASDAGPTIVDMPGYGYAKAPKRQVRDWTRLVFEFLRGRPNLRRVYVLVDARHGIKDNDREVLDLLDRAAVSYQIVLTKADKISPADLARATTTTEQTIARRPAAFPAIMATSAATGLGIDILRAEIMSVAKRNQVDEL